MRPKQFGYIHAPPRPKDWRFRGLSGAVNEEILREDGQWDAYLPVFEPQSCVYFDTMACVTFGNLNCLETLFFRQFDFKYNFSDRAMAKLDGTTPAGNGMWDVAEAIRKKGLIDEAMWPFGPWIKDWDAYYADVPAENVETGLAFLTKWKLRYQFVNEDQDSLIEALKYAPLAVAIHAYGKQQDAIYQRTAAPSNHIVMLYGYQLGQYWKVFDNYHNEFKKLAWDSKFWCALRWSIEKLNPNEPTIMTKLQKNSLVVVVDTGERLMNIDGTKLYDDPTKISTELMARNAKIDPTTGKGYADGYPVDHVKAAEVVDLPRVNLKNVPV